jgi:hypothetical protein
MGLAENAATDVPSRLAGIRPPDSPFGFNSGWVVTSTELVHPDRPRGLTLAWLVQQAEMAGPWRVQRDQNEPVAVPGLQLVFPEPKR